MFLGAGPRVELGLTNLWDPFGNRSSLQYWQYWHSHNDLNADTRFRRPVHFPVMLQKHVGVRGGTRIRKTCVLSAVPMPIRLHGHLVGVEGVEPSPRGPRPRILPLYDTPMMKQAVFLLSGGLYKTTCFKCGSLRLNAISHWRPQGELNPCLRRDKPT